MLRKLRLQLTPIVLLLMLVLIPLSPVLAAVTIVTENATGATNASGILWGNVTAIDNNCTDRGFSWGLTVNYTDNWTEEAGNYSTGLFNHTISTLSPGTTYHFRAEAMNDTEWAYGDDNTFVTVPDAPTNFTAETISETRIDLSWTKGDGANNTMVRRQTGSYPVGTGDGSEVYNGDSDSYVDTGLSCSATYYYRAWSYTSPNYSDSYDGAINTTNECTGYQEGAGVLYENHNTGDDAAAEAYAGNWLAQTFTLGSTTHTVTKVRLKLYRTGEPGAVTVSIRQTDGSGHPITQDLTANVTSAVVVANFTTDSGGDWYDFTMLPEYSLEASTKYAIVVRAVAGDNSNKIHWRYDNGNGYASGNYESSADSGVSWTANNSNDFMFEVYGNELLKVMDAGVYASMMEDGDWLLVFMYKNMYPPYYQYEESKQYFNLQLVDDDGSTVLAQGKMAAWGYKPGSIYLSDEASDSLTWLDDYIIRMEGTDVKFDTPLPSASYTFLTTDWVGNEKYWLKNWVINEAENIGEYYSGDADMLLIREIGDQTLPEPILNELGGEIFLTGIPNLNLILPELFYQTSWSPDVSDTDWTHKYEEGLVWQEKLSTTGDDTGQIPSTLNAIGNQINLSGKAVGWLLAFILYAVTVGIAVYATGKIATGVVIALPVLVAGTWLGLVPMAAVMVAAALAVLAAVWLFWLRST